MARRDGTGPMGQGPLSGRGMGFCATEAVARPYGRGVGYGGRGMASPRGGAYGRGMRRRDFSCRQGFGPVFGGYPVEPVETMSEKEWLSEEKAALEERLNLVNKELGNLNDE